MHDTILAPSILAGNHAHLSDSAKTISDVGLKWVHLDIMDGHFVPNLTFGPQTLRSLRKNSNLYFDTHLMLNNPHLHIEAFAHAGADNITIHIEPEYPIAQTLKQIRNLGLHCGISLNPDTHISEIFPFLEIVDLVLIMTVQPGFGGQAFREDTLEKISTIESWRQKNGSKFRLEVDGGINLKTAKVCKQYGVDTFVAGTSFFQAENTKDFVQEITSL